MLFWGRFDISISSPGQKPDFINFFKELKFLQSLKKKMV